MKNLKIQKEDVWVHSRWRTLIRVIEEEDFI